MSIPIYQAPPQLIVDEPDRTTKKRYVVNFTVDFADYPQEPITWPFLKFGGPGASFVFDPQSIPSVSAKIGSIKGLYFSVVFGNKHHDRGTLMISASNGQVAVIGGPIIRGM